MKLIFRLDFLSFPSHTNLHHAAGRELNLVRPTWFEVKLVYLMNAKKKFIHDGMAED